ncbi:hypothetical protein KUTeg_001548 [Tegillarca granosa]|uniref:DH domain-containing protein n=1 Tax=Tegillarca granosa TaxID=220873 RepID=A0ABQ9FUY8_TEGGR|nr:hypothetical protein KUTeg_001548 [Tegillarca granosa]
MKSIESGDREKQEQLSEILNNYSSNGLPPCPENWPSYNDEIFEIEPHWSSIVDNASTLTKRQHDQQEAIWELLQTEVYYVKSLRVITDLFMCCLISLQKDVLCEIDIEKLFSNIEDIARVNCSMWECYLQKVLQVARETRSPFNPSDMKEGFKQFLNEYNTNFDLRAPMPGCGPGQTRSLIMQSVLKLKDAQTRMDVACLLFTDLLLVCKPSKRMEKYKIIKPPMRVDRIIVHELKDKGSFLLIYLNEYHVPVTAFTFHHSDQNAIRLWLDQIKKAQDLYSEVRNSVQINDGLSYLTCGEVVEEEVIGITPLKSPDDEIIEEYDLDLSREHSDISTIHESRLIDNEVKYENSNISAK